VRGARVQSQFSARTLAEIFRDLYLGERSGTLVLTHQGEEKRVHFDRGMILFAEATAPDESLESCLLASGQLSLGALAEGKEQLPAGGSAAQLAEVLVRRELIGRTVLNDCVRSLTARVVESVFRWEGGNGRFLESPAASRVFETDILTTFDSILQGIFCMAGFGPIHEAMCGLDNRLRVRQAAPLPLERLTLSPAHGFILSRVDGSTKLQQLLSIVPPGEEETAVRLAFGLLVLGLLEYDPPLSSGPLRVGDLLQDHERRQEDELQQEEAIREAYARMRDGSPHEVLGVSATAGTSEIEAAYARLKEEFQRERLQPRVRDRFRSELGLIQNHLLEAYLVLTRPTLRSRHEAHPVGGIPPGGDVTLRDLNVRVEIDRAKSKVALDEAQRKADQYFSKGRKFMRDGDFHNAIQYARLAIAQNPSDARYYFTLADCLARNPEARWQRMAEENYTKATELDPWNPEYWISLGRLYKKQGLKLRARKQFEEALKLVPNHPDVLSELKGVG